MWELHLWSIQGSWWSEKCTRERDVKINMFQWLHGDGVEFACYRHPESKLVRRERLMGNFWFLGGLRCEGNLAKKWWWRWWYIKVFLKIRKKITLHISKSFYKFRIRTLRISLNKFSSFHTLKITRHHLQFKAFNTWKLNLCAENGRRKEARKINK